MKNIKLFEHFENNKVWGTFPTFPALDENGMPDWKSIPKEIADIYRECFWEDEIQNAFQLLEIPTEDEYDQHDEPNIRMAEFLRENGFTGKYIIVDNRW